MKKFSILAATAAAIAVLSVSPVAAKASKPAAQASAVARVDGKPNLNGVWQVLNTANWNLEPHSAASNPLPAADRLLGAIAAMPASVGVVEGGTIPYKPEALERLKQNRANLITHDPEAACYLPGIPRASYMDHPFQIIQGDAKDDILVAYQYASANRVINIGEVGIPPIDTWMGTSYGQWEGDTLVVTTLAQGPGDVKLPGGALEPGVTWLDRAGNYLSNTTTVVERFTLRDKDHIDYEVTITDPELYTRPWKISMPLYRRVEANAQLLDFRCVPFSESLLYGDLQEKK